MSVRHAVRLGFAVLPVSASDCCRPAVVRAHLTGMSERIESPLDRTPLWTLDELCAKVHATRRMVHD